MSEREREAFVLQDCLLRIFHLLVNTKYRIGEATFKRYKMMSKDLNKGPLDEAKCVVFVFALF